MRACVVVLLAGLCLAAAGSAQKLTYIELDKPELLNPIDGGQDAIGVRLLELIFRGLVTQDRAGEWVPELAEALPSFTPGTRELVVRLKGGAQWPDEHPITAQDVAFSLQYYLDEDNGYPMRDLLDIFERVEVVDPQTVRFVLRWSDERAIPRMGFYLLPRHLLPGPYIPDTHGFHRTPFGAGPYRVTANEANLIRLARNPYYQGTMPSITQIEMVVNPVDNVHLALLLAGQVDLDPVVPPRDIATVDANAQTELRRYDSRTWSGFALNCTNPFLRLREARQALSLLFNRQDALQADYYGQGQLVSGPFTVSSFCYDPDVKPYEYDPVAGCRLLDEAGLVDTDGDGVREMNGQPMVLRMVLRRDMGQEDKNTCANFAQQLQSYQVKVETNYQEYNAWRQTIFFKHEYDITLLGWKFDDGSNVYPLFSRTQRAPGALSRAWTSA